MSPLRKPTNFRIIVNGQGLVILLFAFLHRESKFIRFIK